MSMCSVPGSAAPRPAALLALGAPRFHRLVLAAVAVVCLISVRSWAQAEKTRSSLDLTDKPKAKAKLMERYRAKLEVKDDAEWGVIQERIEAILKAQRDLQSALQVTQHRSRSLGSKSGKSSKNSTTAGDSARLPEEESESEVLALQKLVESRAPAQELKPRLARVRDLLRARQEKLNATREDLRVVLSSRQEAIAVLNGLLR